MRMIKMTWTQSKQWQSETQWAKQCKESVLVRTDKFKAEKLVFEPNLPTISITIMIELTNMAFLFWWTVRLRTKVWWNFMIGLLDSTLENVFTYAEVAFSISSGILTSLDGAVLLVRTQNVTKMRKFCVALTRTNAVLT